MAAFLLSVPLVAGAGVSVDAWATPEPQAGERVSFSSRVDLATVNVVVLDRQDLPVPDLAPSDFVVREDGVEHDVAVILTPHDSPLEVAVAIDISGSILATIPLWKRHAASFLNALSSADCVYFYAFRQDVIPGFWASPGTLGLWELLDRGEPGGGTGLFDALIFGLLQLEVNSGSTILQDLGLIPLARGPTSESRRPARSSCGPMSQGADTWRRRALVVLTDGMDGSESYGEADVAIAANLVRVPIFAVGTLGPGAARRGTVNAADAELGRVRRLDRPTRRSLRQLTEITGGREIAGYRAGLETVVQWLRGSYVLGYYRKGENDSAEAREFVEHEIDVELRRSGLRLFSQSGYFRHTGAKAAARSALETGGDMMDQQQVDAAVIAFDQAIQADPLSADGYYQRAVAYLRLGRVEEASEDALKAAELRPGVGIVHQLAARLALRLGDYETSWDQAILANRAASDTGAIFRELREVSEEPPDLEERLGSLRVFLWAGDVFSIRARAALPKIEGRLRQALSRSRSLVVVASREAADLILSLEVDSLSEGRTRRMRGTLHLTDRAGSYRVYESNFRISDIDDGLRATREFAEHVTEIEQALGRDR